MECRIVRQGLWWSESASSAWLILAKRGYCRAGLGQERCCGRAMCRHGSFIGCRGVAYNSVGYHSGTTVSRTCRSLAFEGLGVGPPARRYFFTGRAQQKSSSGRPTPRGTWGVSWMSRRGAPYPAMFPLGDEPPSKTSPVGPRLGRLFGRYTGCVGGTYKPPRGDIQAVYRRHTRCLRSTYKPPRGDIHAAYGRYTGRGLV